jgi:hypothetical protein
LNIAGDEMLVSFFIMLMAMGAFFSLVAAAMAYLITYTEYEKHYNEKRKARLLALESAAFMFVLFMVITLVAACYFGSQAPSVNPS